MNLGLSAMLMVVAMVPEKQPAARAVHAEVVFVCAHGNAKSLIASSWFNRLADERGMGVRSVARGLTPENPVPALIAERLRQEGIEVAGFEARSLTPKDLDDRSRVILIGVHAPPWARDGLEIETWDGIPPASENYEASRDALRTRTEKLLHDLAKGKRRP